MTMVTMGHGLMAVLLAAAGPRRLLAQETWMGDNWEKIKDKTLLQITLPGSHNAGNTPQLSADRLCVSDYTHQAYLQAAPEGLRGCLADPAAFDARFIQWNINHEVGIDEQLSRGVRWFHMKVCNFNPPGAKSMDLARVFHQHRGYTSPVSLAETLSGMRRFLAAHPREFIVLGFNNLHSNFSSTFDPADVAALARALGRELEQGGLGLVGARALAGSPLAELAARGRRAAVFVGGAAQDLPAGILPSAELLAEDWDDAAMDGGGLAAAEAWLLKDLRESASRRGRFYVMQANPNNADAAVYALLRAEAAGVSGLLPDAPRSLHEWERPLLRRLGAIVDKAMAEEPRIQINAISTDFHSDSDPYAIAMRLNGLPARPAGEVPTRAAPAACLNPAVRSGRFADSAVDASRFELKATYVMQRHTDRWLYEHGNLNNTCWPGQLSSSRRSSPLAAAECDFGSRVLRTAWQAFPERTDPYAAPAAGMCQVGDTPQGIQQGWLHAAVWGAMLREQYIDSGLVHPRCPAGAVQLHGDNDYHASQLALETEYEALCGRPPDPREFPAGATLAGRGPGQARGSPWYLQTGQCAGPRLEALSREASEARLASRWWRVEVQAVAKEVASKTGHDAPESTMAASFLDSVLDCATVHSCIGLPDTPREFLSSQNMLPDLEDGGLYARMNGNETAERLWNLKYWRAKSEAAFAEYASLFYGYFLAVIADQLQAAAHGDPRAPKLTISVMSDSNISPLLAIYNLSALASRRPPYLSALIHEVYHEAGTSVPFVRVLYNGRVLRVCAGRSSFPLCPMAEWLRTIADAIPSRGACPALYEGYEFLTGEPPAFGRSSLPRRQEEVAFL